MSPNLLLAALVACRQPEPEICKESAIPQDYAAVVHSTTDGKLLSWPVEDGETVIDVYFQDATVPDYLDTENTYQAVSHAYFTWQNALDGAVSFDVHKASEYDLSGEDPDTISTVSFADAWTGEQTHLGFTTMLSDQDGNIRKFDTTINADNFDWTVDDAEEDDETHDVQAVMTHEIGHNLGLNDLYDCPSPAEPYSIMCQSNTPVRDLYAFDLDVVDAVYGECAE